jgi:hypothetical protein
MKGNILDVYQLEKTIKITQYISTSKKEIKYHDFKELINDRRRVL